MEAKLITGMRVRFAGETPRDEILSLKRSPGAVLDETPLAKRFGMSRAPGREAIIRLAGDDPVVTLSNRCAAVAPTDVQSFQSHVKALDITQRINTRLAAELRGDLDLKTVARRQVEFVDPVHKGEHLAMTKANTCFHIAIAAAARNPSLPAFYARLLDQGHDGVRQTDAHDEMMAAIPDRGIARTDAYADAHSQQFRESFVQYMKQSFVRDADFVVLGPAA